MKLLALDTSGDACSAALLRDGVLTQRLVATPRRHGELILDMLNGLIEDSGLGLAELDGLAFGRGPGSFTGVRIAVSVAQGIALGAGLRTLPVSTLAALAQGEHRRTGRRRICAALDARMGEVYWGCFELGADGLMVPCGVPGAEELVCPPQCVPVPEGRWWGAGPGWSAQGERLAARLGPALEGIGAEAICEAADIARLGAAALASGLGLPPELAQPIYLRDRVTDRGGPTVP